MLVSVIVPTHRPDFLREAVDSALAQRGPEVEVVVVPNNGASVSGLLPQDPRVRVVEYGGPPLVGGVKRFAFGAARGDLLVELDHDDLLAPGALGEVAEASGKAGFVYSNFAMFRDDGRPPTVYGRRWGWRHRFPEVMGRRVVEHVAFDPTPASMARVFYAPNHVRSWTREAYETAGGHDPGMGVCDDHDLVLRTHLSGARMARVDRCLYLQREHAGNTSAERSGAIGSETERLYQRDIEALVLRWARAGSLPAYDLGGGHNPRAGWTPVDLEGAEVVADLRGAWPWRDSSVGAFRAYDILEHLPDKMHTLSEIHRCLAPGGWLLSATPSALGQGAFQDPTHASYWVRNSFYYVTNSEFAKYIRNTSVRFQAQRLWEGHPTAWHRQHDIKYVHFDGVCLKPGYDGPGPHDI